MKAGVQTSADPALARALAALAEVAGRLGAAEVAEQAAVAAGRLAAGTFTGPSQQEDAAQQPGVDGGQNAAPIGPPLRQGAWRFQLGELA
jgi:hypothetical protein